MPNKGIAKKNEVMSKMKKRAELEVADADKFPIESLREKLARRYGLDAVALSGPCEGQPIVECICDQLAKRWDRIKDRFAGNTDKTLKLAHILAESFMQKDDTQNAIKDIQKMGFDKSASTEIAGYLKAFAMDDVAEDEFNNAADEADKAPSADDDDGLGDTDSPFSDDSTPDFGGETPSTDDADDAGTDIVDVELPEEGGGEADLDNPIIEDVGTDDLGGGFGEGAEETVTIEIPKEVANEIAHSIIDGLHGGGKDDLDIEIVDEPMGDLVEDVVEDVGNDLGDDLGGIPGEPNDEQGDEGEQFVTNDVPEEEINETPADEASESPAEQASEDSAGTVLHYNEFKSKEAALKLRAGVIRKANESTVLKIGPEMSINNTDQLAGHDKKKLGPAKEKQVGQERKSLDEQVKPEGYTAGGNKFQDGSKLKNEQKFDPKTVDKGSLSGGKKSIMGPNESYPENKPEVPAGSAAIGGESWSGGNTDTLGIGGVIATIIPNGIVVETENGKKYRGHAKIAGLSSESIARIADGIGKIAFDGDGKKFTLAALKVVASECKDCKTYDGGKEEAKNFTNDGEKKPEGDSKGKKSTTPAEEEPTCDNGKKEVEHFTNDGEKKPEGDKKAASAKNKRTAADKKVEEPKPLDENVKTEGYSAGDTKFQDGSKLKNEEKFDAKKINESDFTGGDKSLMGKDESYAKDGPSVPAGGPPLSHDEHEGGNVSTTKGQGAIANQSQKSQVLADTQSKLNDANVREQRLKAASVYVADMLRHGEISETEYTKELEKVANLPVQAIQSMIVSVKKARERVANTAAKQQGSRQPESLTVPIIVGASSNEPMSLKDRLVAQMKITRDLDYYETLPDRKR